jgi:hypothetical protein
VTPPDTLAKMTPMRGRFRARVLCSTLIVLASVAGCTSSKHATTTSSKVSAAAAATRWWSNSAVQVGSSIDPAAPTSAAGALHPSLSDYCGMLKQTLQAGKSILPTGSATDPKILTSSEAFFAELEAVAPASVSASASWHLLGPVIVGLVKAGGTLPTASSADTAKNLQAAEAINADSKKNCKLDLSAVVPGG